MAHYTQVKGAISEKTVEIALMSNGWAVAGPTVDELYDLVARDPSTGEFKTLQVKTIRRRTDRKNEKVIYATNGKGEPYTPDACDLIVGVEGADVYLVPCSGLREYWCKDGTEDRRGWTKLKISESGAVFNG